MGRLMSESASDVGSRYEKFYAQRSNSRVYPTEFVVRTFLAKYPELDFRKPDVGERVLDVAFGDGRNTSFLCDQGYAVSGVEITEGIVLQTGERLSRLGHEADLRVGRNSSLPFPDAYFDYVLACHCCYYCDEGETFADNMKEYARVMKPGAWMVASLADRDSYIFNGATALSDGSMQILSDPYGNRDGYRLHAFSHTSEVRTYLSTWFTGFSFGSSYNVYFGISARLFWVVCRKRDDA